MPAGSRLTAIVLGGANTLALDKTVAAELFEPRLIIACNHAGRDEPGRVDHWATMHPDLFPLWVRQRCAAGRPDAGQLWHGRQKATPVDSREVENWGGSSGLLCVRVAIELGCERIILAGVPMHKNARHYDSDARWFEARQYWGAWEKHKPHMADRVRSMSGWTRDLLGAPTREWLDD